MARNLGERRVRWDRVAVIVAVLALLAFAVWYLSAQEEPEEPPASDAVETPAAPEEGTGATESTEPWPGLAEKVTDVLGAERAQYAVFYQPLDAPAPFVYQSRPMRSASMIKVFLLAKAMEEVRAGRASLDEAVTLRRADKFGGAGSLAGWADGSRVTLRELLRLMITESDNTATNLIIDRFGMDALNAYIAREGYSDTHLARKMMDFTAARAGRENMTSARDLGRFFLRLAAAYEAGDEEAAYMMELLLAQTDTECLPEALPQLRIAHKTGELDGLYDDGGIVFTEDGPVVLCILSDGLADRSRNLHVMRRLSVRILAEREFL